MNFRIFDIKKLSPLITVVFILSVIALSITTVLSHLNTELFVNAASGIDESKFIIIDPGHGGEDGGAIGVDGTLEKDLNLSIALIIGEMLTERGYTVIYTRTDDRMLYKPSENVRGLRKLSDLKTRVEVAEEHPEALFISIHMNSFGQSKYSGLQLYSSNNNESKRLAEAIRKNVIKDVQPNNKRNVKGEEGIYLLENINTTGVLIECGFLTNETECLKLSEKEYQKRLSFSIVCGIIEYKEGLSD